MAEKPPIHLRGIAGKVDEKTGAFSRPGCKFVVVHQDGDADEAVEYFHGANREDCVEYIRSQKASGHGKGLRIVPASEVL